ncbi:unnamed protein product [Mycena citricolor]|uniref:Uncharacterized protein n=1 Tax=Mycena citricolor TaxID=2018698 RepID=A0AAD2HB17_9AGAR|nr:unnamed protein product [Mycena citricolor]
MLVATFANSGTTVNSLSFVIQNGATTQCSASSSTAASSSSSSTSASASSTPPPSQVAASTGGGRGVNRGAIAGAVVGSLAVVAAAIAVFFYFRYAAKGKPSDGTTSSGSSRKRSPRRWAGDAKAYPSSSGIGIVAGHHHSQSDSIGPILTSSRPSQSHAYSGGDGELDSGSYFSPSQEKISSSPVRSPFSDSGHYALGELERNAVPLEYIGTPPEGGAGGLGRSSSTSTASHLHMNFSRPRSHPGSPYGSASSPTNESPGPSSPTPSSQAHQRNSIGDSLSGSKRMARKPVPQYNPADPSLASVPSAPSSSSSSREGSVRAASGTSPHWPVLEHKSSFGQDGRPVDGRPVHYLIPDMPSSQT